MAALTLARATETVKSTIADELRHAFGQFGERLFSRVETSAVVGTVSQDILDRLLASPESAMALLALLENPAQANRHPVGPTALAQESDAWLKTEEVAKRMGFSRPYVNALIDAGEFGAGAAKSDKGHRRVKSGAVEKWILDHNVVASAKVRRTLLTKHDPAEFFDHAVLSCEEEAQLLSQINKEKKESIKHRPARKRT